MHLHNLVMEAGALKMHLKVEIQPMATATPPTQSMQRSLRCERKYGRPLPGNCPRNCSLPEELKQKLPHLLAAQTDVPTSSNTHRCHLHDHRDHLAAKYARAWPRRMPPDLCTQRLNFYKHHHQLWWRVDNFGYLWHLCDELAVSKLRAWASLSLLPPWYQ